MSADAPTSDDSQVTTVPSAGLTRRESALRFLGEKALSLWKHPGFRAQPVRCVGRLVSWRWLCLVKRPVTVRLPRWGVKLELQPQWHGGGTSKVFVFRERYEP